MEPILNGAPGFILLALVVALAGYLRQVSVSAQDRIEQIESEKHTEMWPKGAVHTKAKLTLLGDTKKKIEWITLPLFIFIALVAFRSVLYALTRAIPTETARQYVGCLSNIWSDQWLRVMDLFLTGFLLTLVLGMWVMHQRGKKRDKEIGKLRPTNVPNNTVLGHDVVAPSQ